MTAAELEPDEPDPGQVVDLGPILGRTRASRIIRVPYSAIREDSLTPYELVAVGRALELTPDELVAAVRARAGWTAVELAQAFAWVILRREEPALTWEEARTFRLDLVGPEPADPPRRRAARRSRRAGTSGA